MLGMYRQEKPSEAHHTKDNKSPPATMEDGLMGAFCGLYGEPGLAGLTEEAAVTALSAHGLCGELAAAETAKRGGGTGTFRMYLLDKMSLLDDGTLERGKKIEIR